MERWGGGGGGTSGLVGISRIFQQPGLAMCKHDLWFVYVFPGNSSAPECLAVTTDLIMRVDVRTTTLIQDNHLEQSCRTAAVYTVL